MQKKELFFMFYLRAQTGICLTDVILAALNSLVVTPIKTQATAPLVHKANNILLVHHSVVDGEDLMAILTFKPLVVVDGEDLTAILTFKPLVTVDGVDQVLKVIQLQAVDGEDVKILLVLLLQVEVPQDHLPNQILWLF